MTRLSSLRQRIPRGRMPSAKMPSTRFASNNKMLSGSHREDSLGAAAQGQLAGVRVASEVADAILQDLANQDEDNEKTYSRQIVEKYLMKYKWYWNPPEHGRGPNLANAWAYYEHVTLPRHFVGDQAADTVLRRAEPGEFEAETELYNPFSMPQSSYIEWGTGIDLYFISLKFFAALMFIAGLINISSIAYYASEEYNGDSELNVALPLRGSAICANTAWVACSDCKESDWSRDKGRFAQAADGTILVLRNLCVGAEVENGITNFTTMLFVLFAVALFSYYLRLREIRYDEDKVTTTDYSVLVKNPPPEAINPDAWRDFFSQFATDGDQVTFVTVTLNNEDLVRKLMIRRILQNQLRVKLPPGTDMDDKELIAGHVERLMKERAEQKVGCIGRILNIFVVPILNIFNLLLAPDVLVEKIEKFTEEIKELQKERYTASHVYVTFETEEGQRTALDALKVGRINGFLNNTNAVSPECLFEGRILRVVEPTEPNTIRWLDISKAKGLKFLRRFITLIITLVIIVFASFCVARARHISVTFAGILTTTFNTIMPQIIKLLMKIEPHSTEGGFQASLYIKITLFRWSLSAILSQAITPVTSTLGQESNDLLPTIYAILLADVWLSPLLRMSDWLTNIKKHILAPRAKTQEEMNLWFQGTYYNIGERYTDFTKVLFVVFFYSALLPAGFFFGAIILALQYYIDKYSLLRIWSWQPFFGSTLAVFSRRFFFTSATVAFAVISSYAWAQFPYDNVCDPDDATSGFDRTYNGVVDAVGDPVNGGVVDVTQSTNVVYCSQAWRDYVGFSFPPTPRIQTDDPSWFARVEDNDLTWMTDSQHTFTLFFGWVAVAIVIITVIAVCGNAARDFIMSFFIGVYEPDGASQHIDFSSNPEIFAYIPQIKWIGQPFPYLACDIDDIDQGLIGWNDSARSYDWYNLIYDVPHKSLRRTKIIAENTRGTKTIAEQDDYTEEGIDLAIQHATERAGDGFEVVDQRPIYSQVRHYPTQWQLDLAEKEALERLSK